MNRLTKNVGNDYTYKNRYNQAYHKLGKLEDIEERLGCPLDVVFKALKDGIYNGVPKHYNVSLGYLMVPFVGYVYVLYTFGHNGIDGCYPVLEYKKTWWLKEDRSE